MLNRCIIDSETPVQPCINEGRVFGNLPIPGIYLRLDFGLSLALKSYRRRIDGLVSDKYLGKLRMSLFLERVGE